MNYKSIPNILSFVLIIAGIVLAAVYYNYNNAGVAEENFKYIYRIFYFRNICLIMGLFFLLAEQVVKNPRLSKLRRKVTNRNLTIYILLASILILFTPIFFSPRNLILFTFGTILSFLIYKMKDGMNGKWAISIIGIVAILISLPFISYKIYFNPLNLILLIYPLSIYLGISKVNKRFTNDINS